MNLEFDIFHLRDTLVRDHLLYPYILHNNQMLSILTAAKLDKLG